MSRIWTQQPQVPVQIDWSNGLTKGLWFAQEASVGQRNLVDSVAATAALGSPVASQYGIAQAFTTTGSSFGSPTTLTGATQATWEVMFKTSSTASAINLFHQWDTQKWLIQISGTGLVWVAAQNGGWRLRWDKTGIFAANTWYHLVLSWTGGTTYVAYLNGVPITLSFVEGGTSSIGTAVTPLKLGAFNASGQVVFARSWARGLSATECKSLSDNPWQIFAPLPSRIFVGPAAASGDTNLTVADSTHGHTAEEVTLTGVGSDTALTVADSSHAHYGDSPVLTNAAFLAVADCLHGHTSDDITLDGGIVLTVADSSHGHAVDEPSLTTASILAIQDALHSHAADNVILSGTSDVDLTIAGALHAHTADNVTLTGDLTDSEKIDLILDILSNKQEIDPSTGLFTLYADDGSTVLLTAAAWEDINGTVPYRGRGLKRLDALH